MKCTECDGQLTDDESKYLVDTCNECMKSINLQCNRHDDVDNDFIQIFGKITAVVLFLLLFAINV